jgi:hypothetical protein
LNNTDIQNQMAKKKIESKETGFVNPFANGVNYKMFLEAVGKSTVADYCKNNLTEDEVEFLINDLKHYKK